MAFCKKCGATINDSDMFCRKCGTKNYLYKNDSRQKTNKDEKTEIGNDPLSEIEISGPVAANESSGCSYATKATKENDIQFKNKPYEETALKKKTGKLPFIIGGVAAIIIIAVFAVFIIKNIKKDDKADNVPVDTVVDTAVYNTVENINNTKTMQNDKPEEEKRSEQKKAEEISSGNEQTAEEKDDFKMETIEEVYGDLDKMCDVFEAFAFEIVEMDSLKGKFDAGEDDYWRMIAYLAFVAKYKEELGIVNRTTDDWYIAIPEDEVIRIASAFDATFDGKLRDIDEKSEYASIKYDPDTREYMFVEGDMGMQAPTLFGILDNGDGTFTVYGGFASIEYDDTTSIDDYCKILVVPNEYAKTHPEVPYRYSVKSVTESSKEELDKIIDQLRPFSEDYIKDR